MKGQSVRRWAASTIRSLGALYALVLFTEAAQAGSRFETIPMPGTKPTVSLDVTIVIPQVVYLGSAPAEIVNDPPQPLSAKGANGAMSSEPYVVLTNAGTLAFAPTRAARAQSWDVGTRGREPGASPISVYLVAIP
ncbi:hypothetical protein GCM10009076_16540 [Erythrobacter ramosus]